MTSKLSQPYHLDESILIRRGIRVFLYIFFFFSFFDEIPVSKTVYPKTRRHIWGYILFGYVPNTGRQAYSELVRVAQQRDSTRRSRVEKASSMVQRS